MRHGSASNPPNRFERLHYDFADAELGPDDERPDPRVQYLRDPARSLIATNQSPDVGFAASINPYRGCEHACAYCLSPATPVLRADFSVARLEEIQVGDRVIGFDEHGTWQSPRKLRMATVLAKWWSTKPTLRIVTDASEVIASPEHRWLEMGGRWTRTDRLAIGAQLQRLDPVTESKADPDALAGELLSTLPERVRAIEPGPPRSLVDIQTSTGTFFAAGLCTHNCYARPTHEYLGFSSGLDFETKILVKQNAPELLRRELASPRWKPQLLALSGVTDAYQPIERKLGITRRCLEVLVECRNPVVIVTKSRLVARDADLLAELARFGCARVMLSVTTLDPELHRLMEPRTPRPSLRLAAIEALAAAGVPVGVLVAPVVPGLTDHEIPRILRAVADAGARSARYVLLRLPHANKQLVEDWLARSFPDRKDKVLNRLRALGGGKLYDSGFGRRQTGGGIFADQIAQLFAVGMREAGLSDREEELRTEHFRRPTPVSSQLALF